MNTYAKTAKKLSVAMLNSSLPTNFQLNIFISKARVNLQTLLQSLKQTTSKSVHLGTFCGKFTCFFCLKKHAKIAFKVICRYVQQEATHEFKLNIFIFEAKTSLQILLQSLKQNTRKSAQVGNTANT